MDAYMRLLSLPEVISRVSLRKSAVYARLSQDEFPKPVNLGRRVAWISSEIDDWITLQIQRRDLESAAATRRAETVEERLVAKVSA